MKLDYWVFNSFKELEQCFIKEYPPNWDWINWLWFIWENKLYSINSCWTHWVICFYRRIKSLEEEWDRQFIVLFNEINEKRIEEISKQKRLREKKSSNYNAIKLWQLENELDKSRIDIMKQLDTIKKFSTLSDFQQFYWYVLPV